MQVAKTGYQAAHAVAQAARWVELDETTAAITGDVNNPLVTAMGFVDGTVTVHDGWQNLRKGLEQHDPIKTVGGVGRVGLGALGMIPGVTGCYAEAVYGLWCAGEGLISGDRGDVVNGVAQTGLASTIAAYSLHMMPGPWMFGLVMGMGAAKLAYNVVASQLGDKSDW